MSPPTVSDEELNDPHVGNLGESPEAFERRRLAQLNADAAAARLNDAQADIPMRENFGPHESGSWDTPEMTRSAIADMAAGRAGARIRAAQGLPPRNIVPPPPPRELAVRPEPEVHAPPLAMPPGVSAELGLMVREVIGELGRGLAQKFDDLRQDLEENTRLLGVMNAPMEAITDSHERAASSFETLRREIAGISGSGSSPAIEALAKVVDTAGLTEAQSRAERRFEELAAAIVAALTETRKEVKQSIDACALNMLKVLHLLERLQARELREAKRRAGAPA
jgi:hypothetical protein